MTSTITRWSVRLLLKRRNSIDLKPAYQRGPAWTDAQKSLLIDSLFRQLEIPLLFLAGTSNNGLNAKRDVIDGQQRLRAIYEFVEDRVRVPGDALGRQTDDGLLYSDLTGVEREQLLSRKLAICSLDGINAKAKRLQFERLQLGQHLKPVELRNALASAAPLQIRNLAETHSFFEHAGIPDKRYKREDYLTHIFALCNVGQTLLWRDIKAPALRRFIQDSKKGIPPSMLARVDEVLDFLKTLVVSNGSIFKNKWSFVDGFWLIYRDPTITEKHSTKELAKRFARIEQLRKDYYRNSELLIEGGNAKLPKNAKLLYDYINSYKAGGAIRHNIEARRKYLVAEFQ